jgi:hypothetical protein
MNPENPYHKEALVAGLATAIGDYEELCAKHNFPATNEGRTAFCVEVLTDWNIAVKHMEAIIDAAIAKVEEVSA